jgi:hypothetical protein
MLGWRMEKEEHSTNKTWMIARLFANKHKTIKQYDFMYRYLVPVHDWPSKSTVHSSALVI